MHPCEDNKDGCRELLTLPRTPETMYILMVLSMPSDADLTLYL